MRAVTYKQRINKGSGSRDPTASAGCVAVAYHFMHGDLSTLSP